jgi:hypothetical protein
MYPVSDVTIALRKVGCQGLRVYGKFLQEVAEELREEGGVLAFDLGIKTWPLGSTSIGGFITLEALRCVGGIIDNWTRSAPG